jgi:hypothetical protein
MAQVPQALNYQAVARDNSGNILANRSISVRLSVLDGSNIGPSLYAETHNPTTNQFGLFTLAVGTGQPVSGVFSQIVWPGSSKWLKVELDANGGANYVLMGSSQLLTVPFAFFADSSRNPGPQGPAGPQGIQGLQGPQGPAGPLVSGTNGQTLRHDGNTWVATSNLFHDGNNVGIGNTSPSTKLDVSGGVRMTGFAMPTGAGANKVLTSDASGNGTWQTFVAGGGGTLDQAYDFGGAGVGRIVNADAGAVEINSSVASGTALDVNISGASAIAYRADNTGSGVGFLADNTNSSNTFSAIQASTNSTSQNVAGVTGNSTGAASGVAGQATATSTAQQAVYGSNLRTTGGHGVRGIGFNGVVGETNYMQGYAVYGENYDAIGTTGNGVGVAGKGYYGVFGQDRYNGGMAGAYGVYANGNFGATGTKTFRIDHPLDPENKYLIHNSVESPEVLNLYRGTVKLDAAGNSTVVLPTYFHAANQNFSYHLTPIGGPSTMYVAEKINQGQFKIAGGQPGMEVSWMVIAERNDPYMQNRPHLREVEPLKNDRDKGKYLMPLDHGQPTGKSLFKEGESSNPGKRQPLNIR